MAMEVREMEAAWRAAVAAAAAAGADDRARAAAVAALHRLLGQLLPFASTPCARRLGAVGARTSN